jgi:hypothetical protein
MTILLVVVIITVLVLTAYALKEALRTIAVICNAQRSQKRRPSASQARSGEQGSSKPLVIALLIVVCLLMLHERTFALIIQLLHAVVLR